MITTPDVSSRSSRLVAIAITMVLALSTLVFLPTPKALASEDIRLTDAYWNASKVDITYGAYPALFVWFESDAQLMEAKATITDPKGATHVVALQDWGAMWGG